MFNVKWWRFISVLLLSSTVGCGVIFRPDDRGIPSERLVTFEIIITATPNPNQTPHIVYIIVTATPEGTSPSGEANETWLNPTQEAIPVVTALPTITLAPTAANAQVVIDQVINAGDITREEVVIRNTGNTLNLTGWTLSDGDGNVFVFDERRLFSGATLRINTRAGQPTPVVLFWGRDEAVFAVGDVVVLADGNGAVQATLRLPASGSD